MLAAHCKGIWERDYGKTISGLEGYAVFTTGIVEIHENNNTLSIKGALGPTKVSWQECSWILSFWGNTF